ncbi:sodium:solute symporter family protein [Halorhodospira sp. 9621]|uniref:sodium:solute symporter family protein n=1 Tax=Halorhodospira TaxID=85108 RepID=UPI001911C59A|nr:MULTISPECIES: sodium:solute symporter family protein [Halorhodospira]MBK5944212.1 sodium:solute symporter [Halorhodospira halophila]MCG5532686.1 sodium:solute symporter family protein [Halorhodospira sp. 9621]MCG5542461.1 sodium:solute symporter family protein [Halorhodospira sp. 9628]
MSAMAIWLLVFVGLYWGYCIFWGIKGYLWSRTASDYFVAGRSVSMWVFILAATATSFSGWTFVGHPGLIYEAGLQYAYASFYSICIPFTGMLFLKRQWMIGKRWGYVTPGEMFADYFRTDSIRILILIVALIFAVPYLGIQLRASGFLFHVLTDGWMGVEIGMWLLSAVVLFYVASGGLRAVAYVDAAQAVLLMAGIFVIGIVALYYIGGWNNFTHVIAGLVEWETATGGAGEISPGMVPGDSGASGYVAIPGAIQWVGAAANAQGGVWTGVMNITYMLALGGIMASPSFTMWAFSNQNPRPFAPQQTWMSPLGVGALMFTFLAIQAMATHGLGGNTEFAKDIFSDQYGEELAEYRTLFEPGAEHRGLVDEVRQRLDAGESLDGMNLSPLVPSAVMQRGMIQAEHPELNRQEVEQVIAAGLAALSIGEDPRNMDPDWLAALPGDLERAWLDLSLDRGGDSELVPQLLNMLEAAAPWLAALLAVCALAAMQSTGAAYMSTTSGMFTRDLLRRYIMPNASNQTQVVAGRIFVTILVLAALTVATVTTDALVLLGGLATAMGTQMWVPLAAICFFPWLTRPGVVWGLSVGIIAVLMTENLGIDLLAAMGVDVPWGRWPLTIHSAGWGLVLNALVAVIVSAMTQNNKEDYDHRMTVHAFLREHASLPAEKRHLIPIAFTIVIGWWIFAFGPGALLGNWVFGDPTNPDTWWFFGLPSIWVWQLLWWVIGIYMMWFTCYKCEMSTVPEKEIEVLFDEDQGKARYDVSRP